MLTSCKTTKDLELRNSNNKIYHLHLLKQMWPIGKSSCNRNLGCNAFGSFRVKWSSGHVGTVSDLGHFNKLVQMIWNDPFNSHANKDWQAANSPYEGEDLYHIHFESIVHEGEEGEGEGMVYCYVLHSEPCTGA